MSADDILYSLLSESCYICGSAPATREGNATMAICKPCQAIFDELLAELFKGEGA